MFSIKESSSIQNGSETPHRSRTKDQVVVGYIVHGTSVGLFSSLKIVLTNTVMYRFDYTILVYVKNI